MGHGTWQGSVQDAPLPVADQMYSKMSFKWIKDWKNDGMSCDIMLKGLDRMIRWIKLMRYTYGYHWNTKQFLLELQGLNHEICN